ncbi:hypothetical protein [Halorussus sp. AFM4]|uniref:hypothetical protein n=1 Tax=Halorussus sp. AFM4 TaxID=3421651 RepID=UPI003EB73D3F
MAVTVGRTWTPVMNPAMAASPSETAVVAERHTAGTSTRTGVCFRLGKHGRLGEVPVPQVLLLGRDELRERVASRLGLKRPDPGVEQEPPERLVDVARPGRLDDRLDGVDVRVHQRPDRPGEPAPASYRERVF